MSEIIEVIFPATKRLTPTLRVKCACGRVYVTNQWAGTVRRLKHCVACVPRVLTITKKNASRFGKLGMQKRWGKRKKKT